MLAIATLDGNMSDEQPIMRFPIGEYYSPMYDTRELTGQRERLWPAVPRETVGINWREPSQVALCRDVFARQEHCEFSEDAVEDATEYFAMNGQYPPLDAWVLEAMMRHFRPRRMIEVGCGFSTLVTARVNREHFDSQISVTCIEPYPRPFLTDGSVAGIEGVRVEKIQDAPLALFEALGRDDILFIDTSHTVKTGGDVTWIFHEIMPRLAPGVIVHIHDFFLPGEYPEPWVLEGWGWNESYLVRSFLTFNDAFEIVWGTVYMATNHFEDLLAAFPGFQRYLAMSGGSLWIRRHS
jgi:predicted O-methyltransferase YrrM